MIESIVVLAVILLAVWILYKVKVFLAVSYFTEAAVIAADDFASKVAHKSAMQAIQYEIDPETFRKSVASRSRNRAYRQSMYEGVTNYDERERPEA